MIQIAKKEDATTLATLLTKAMDEIAYLLANTNNEPKMLKTIAHFISQKNNRLSYENILVDSKDGKIRGAILFFPCKDIAKLDRYILEYHSLKKPFPKECPSSGIYLDSIATFEEFRGAGIAKNLINELKIIAKKRGFKKMWLIADEDKKHLVPFYNSLGFEIFGQRKILNHTYHDMYIKL